MKIKKVKIGIRSVESAMEGFVKTAEAAKRGEKVKKESGVYFTSIEAFRKALTPQRLGLLRLIRESAPASLHELARLAHRNIKNVSDDVSYLAQAGLVDLREPIRRFLPGSATTRSCWRSRFKRMDSRKIAMLWSR